jgi:ParB-like chromosome segregation protein Spo0J
VSTPPEVHTLRIAEVGVNYSPRRERLNDDHVCALSEVIDQLPPIIVDKRTMSVIDGIHRLEAHRRASRTTIRAILFAGDETEALALAIRANVGHGRPLSLGERQTAAATLLCRCPDRSDRWIAQVCALSHSTVGNIRKAVAAEGPPVRVGQDGRRRRAVTPTAPTGYSKRGGHHGPDPNEARISGSPKRIGEAAASAAVLVPDTETRQAAGQPLYDQGREVTRDLLKRSRATLRTGHEVSGWFERTSISEEDVGSFVHHVPLGEVSAIAEECRHRSRLWDELAESLKDRNPTNPPGMSLVQPTRSE